MATKSIRELMYEAHATAVANGFWDEPREPGTMLALIHSEVSEVLEALRDGNREEEAEEMADIIIRVFDYCAGRQLDLEAAVLAKMEKNRGRPRLHGRRF